MIRKEVIELQKLGSLSDNNLGQYIELLEQINYSLTGDEVKILITLFPDSPVTGCGVDWTILHLIESSEINLVQFGCLADTCPSDWWKSEINARIENARRHGVE